MRIEVYNIYYPLSPYIIYCHHSKGSFTLKKIEDCLKLKIMELEKKRMEELRKAVVDLIEMECRYPPFDLFYLMIFPLPNMYDMWVRSII